MQTQLSPVHSFSIMDLLPPTSLYMDEAKIKDLFVKSASEKDASGVASSMLSTVPYNTLILPSQRKT